MWILCNNHCSAKSQQKWFEDFGLHFLDLLRVLLDKLLEMSLIVTHKLQNIARDKSAKNCSSTLNCYAYRRSLYISSMASTALPS